jgi:hypothetical protein
MTCIYAHITRIYASTHHVNMKVEIIQSCSGAWNEIQDTVVEREKSGLLLSMFDDRKITYMFEFPWWNANGVFAKRLYASWQCGHCNVLLMQDPILTHVVRAY